MKKRFPSINDDGTKRCTRCEQVKPLSEFTKSKSQPSGVTSACSECHNRASRLYRESPEGRQKHLSNGRARKLDPRKHSMDLARKRKYTAECSHKRRAHQQVYLAVKSGTLVRPTKCSRCEKECKPEASHHDYSKPLDVEWLCAKCHRRKDFGVIDSAQGVSA